MTKSIFLQTLHSIIRNGKLTEVLQLASVASQCMREVSVGMETIDIRSPLAENTSQGVGCEEYMVGTYFMMAILQGKIVISGASKMHVTFNQKYAFSL